MQFSSDQSKEPQGLTMRKAAGAIYRSVVPEQSRIIVRKVIKKILGKKKKKPKDLEKKPVKAISYVKQKNNDNSQNLLVAAATQLLKEWKLQEALEKVDLALESGPIESAIRLRAQILANLGEKFQAVIANKQLLELKPLDVAGHRQLLALGEAPPKPSISIVMVEVAKHKGNSTVYLRAAEYLYFHEMFAELLQICEIGLAVAATEPVDPRRDRAIRGLSVHKGYGLEATHQTHEALELYQEMRGDRFEAGDVTPVSRCLLELGRPGDGEELLRKAYVSGPDPLPFSNLALDLLQAQRKMRESYLLYRKRPTSQALAKFFQAKKHPLDVNFLDVQYRSKSALLLAEGGPGDELRLSSIYNELSSCFESLKLTCDPRLLSIMERNFPLVDFLPAARHRREIVRPMDDRKSLTDATLFQLVSDSVVEEATRSDLVCSLLDALADLRPNPEAFRHKRSFLQPDADLKSYWKDKTSTSERIKIGISWRSMLQSVARNRHYLKTADLMPLRGLDADFWIIQPQATEEEIAHLQSFLNVHVPEGLDLVDDLEGQLALVANMDFVISPFTTSGELAGAAGIPTFLLASTMSTTWRRNPDGSDIWHESTRIVWGTPIYDRRSGVQTIAEELAQYRS